MCNPRTVERIELNKAYREGIISKTEYIGLNNMLKVPQDFTVYKK